MMAFWQIDAGYVAILPINIPMVQMDVSGNWGYPHMGHSMAISSGEMEMKPPSRGIPH
jgi:hypothetical protein